MVFKKIMEDLPVLPKKHGPKNIPLEAIIALKEKNLSDGDVAKILGCSRPNITQRLLASDYHPTINRLYSKYRPSIYRYIGSKILSSITDKDFKEAKLLEKVKAVSFLHNQERLEEGKSTSNIAYIDMIKYRLTLQDRKQQLLNQYPELANYNLDNNNLDNTIDTYTNTNNTNTIDNNIYTNTNTNTIDINYNSIDDTNYIDNVDIKDEINSVDKDLGISEIEDPSPPSEPRRRRARIPPVPRKIRRGRRKRRKKSAKSVIGSVDSQDALGREMDLVNTSG